MIYVYYIPQNQIIYLNLVEIIFYLNIFIPSIKNVSQKCSANHWIYNINGISFLSCCSKVHIYLLKCKHPCPNFAIFWNMSKWMLF